jgi:hypothetical protein
MLTHTATYARACVFCVRACRQVEAKGGLDEYLLRTPDAQLKSDVASALRLEVINARRRRLVQQLQEHCGSLPPQPQQQQAGQAPS